MSDTNRASLSYVIEDALNVTPTSPKFRQFPYSGAPNLGFTPSTVTSNLIRSDRQIDDLILVGGEAGGDANSELAYEIHDDHLALAFFSEWQKRVGVSNFVDSTPQITNVETTGDSFTIANLVTSGSITVDFASSGNSITRATGSFLDNGFRPGMTVLISGAADAGNNNYFTLVTVSDLVMTTLEALDDEMGDTGVTISQSLVAGDIVRAEGFSNPGNDGFHVVSSGPTATNVPVTSNLVDEAAPPRTAALHHVGRRAATGDLVAAVGPPRLTSTLLNFRKLGLEPGDWVKPRGTGGTWPASNNVWCRVLSVGANTLTFDLAPGWAANAGTGATVDLYFGERLKNGVLRRSETLRLAYEDQDPVLYQYLRGYLVDQAVITAGTQAIVEAAFTYVGMSAEFKDDGPLSGETVIESGPVRVLNSSSNVARLARGGVAISGGNYVTELSFTINNNLRRKNAVGFLGAADIGAGEFSVTGALAAYFDDKTIAQAVVANSETSVDARFEDGAGHLLLMDAPRIKYSEGLPEIAGKNEDVAINANFQAIRHLTFGYTLKFIRVHGAQ
jgi:hypothetical protein